MQWFRFWNKCLESRKVQTLPSEAFKTWVNLLCVACKEEKEGVLPSVADIAWTLRTTPERAGEQIELLIAVGLVVRDESALRIHKWEKWQRSGDATVADRVRRYRARQKALKASGEPPIDPLGRAELRRLRGLSYADYLQSDHWMKVRAFVIKACDGRCSLCNAAGTIQAHHRTYETIGTERPGDVIGLCENCHKTFHENGKVVSTENSSR